MDSARLITLVGDLRSSGMFLVRASAGDDDDDCDDDCEDDDDVDDEDGDEEEEGYGGGKDDDVNGGLSSHDAVKTKKPARTNNNFERPKTGLDENVGVCISFGRAFSRNPAQMKNRRLILVFALMKNRCDGCRRLAPHIIGSCGLMG